MWCQNCQNDVPIVVADDPAKPTCAHCHSVIAIDKPQASPSASWSVDDIRADIREIESIIGDWQKADTPAYSTPTRPPQATPARSTPIAPAVRPNDPLPPAQLSFFVWSLLLIGLLALSFGGALSIWSLVGSQPRLWAVGLPMVILGQSILLFAGLVQFERIQESQRQIRQTIADTQHELRQVEHLAGQLMVSQSGSAQSFYRHLGHKASPHLLLADLKGQMDLLTETLARDAE